MSNHIVYHDDNVDVSMTLSTDKAVCMHIDMKRFTHTLYKKYLEIQLDIEDEFKKVGVTRLFAIVENDHIAGNKLAGLFGFDIVSGHSGMTLFTKNIG